MAGEVGISLAKNKSGSRKTKHIDARYNYTREKVQEKPVRLMHCLAADIVADMPEPIEKEKLETFVQMIGLRKRVMF